MIHYSTARAGVSADPTLWPVTSDFSRAARPPTNGAREVPGDSITIAAAHARARFDDHALSKRSRPPRVASALQAGAPCGAHVGTGAAGGACCEHLFLSWRQGKTAGGGPAWGSLGEGTRTGGRPGAGGERVWLRMHKWRSQCIVSVTL